MTVVRGAVPRLVEPPAVLPVTLDEMKGHLRVAHDDDDADIAAVLEAATAHLDGYGGILGRALIAQTWAIDVTGWAYGAVALPLEPVIDLMDLAAVDPDGGEVDEGLAALWRPGGGNLVRVRTGASLAALTTADHRRELRFRAGYGDDGAAVPAPIKHAIKLLASHWYEHREAVTIGAAGVELPMAVDRLLVPFRRVMS